MHRGILQYTAAKTEMQIAAKLETCCKDMVEEKLTDYRRKVT
jgi:hypothetical protein